MFAVAPVKESMSQDAYKDIYRCMHFSDDWEEEEDIVWDKVYADTKYEPSPDAAKHRKKSTTSRMDSTNDGRSVSSLGSG